MKKHLLFAAMAAFGVSSASAQVGQACVPPNSLTGATWAFSISGAASSAIGAARLAAVGQFTAFPGGYVSVKATIVDTTGAVSQVVRRQYEASGRWMPNSLSPCQSGMLQFMFNGAFMDLTYTIGATPGGQRTLTLTGTDGSIASAPVPVQNYVITGCVGPSGTVPAGPIQPVGGCTSAVSPAMNPMPVSTDPNRPGFPNTWAPPFNPAALNGTAWQGVPTSCPAIGNPLNLLKGTVISSSIGLTDNYLAVPSFNNPNANSGDLVIYRSVDRLNPNLRTSVASAAIPLSALTGFYIPIYTGSSNDRVSPGAMLTAIPVELTYGRYTINSDCSGGELLLMGGNYGGTDRIYRQIEFVFIDNTFTAIRGVVDGSPTNRY